MGLLTFKGGVHPFEGKELSMDKPVEELKPGKELVYLLSQHIGAPAKAIVNKGDHVVVGQKIAEAGGFVSAPIYATVSGTVKSLEKRKNATGGYVDAIVVENDEQYESTTFVEADPESLSREEILDRIREAGVVGMGGAGFPTAVKLAPKDPSTVDHILVNGSECEPYLTSDYRMMLEKPEMIVEGLKIMLKLFGDNCKGLICIENNKPKAIEIMKKAVEGVDRVSVAVVKTKYPEGAERSLINAVTGRFVNSKMLPADAGCVVDNVGTVMAVYDAVKNGKPLMYRVFTVTGDAVKDPRNFLVRIGTPYRELVEAAGGFTAEPEKIISGGPMMGFALADLDVPVTKTSGALTCFLKDEVSRVHETACISCGRCLNVCPARLMPTKLAELAEAGDEEGFESFDGLECVNCGSCSYTCPAKRPLAANINMMRQRVLANKRKK
ncbi:MAG: electron transport complex subunit RsxC [Lachnospiraceae bacterium]|jgi:electron transport complex protein RnfC|nr:electron transport complex subunit RsxC [Lachnospiraceae bacterium]MCI7329328.1 electron transport complex subunit RsxC [Lachnospiraceae bacterium]MDY3301530.1 electron transport complex subunit RsxC [Lachnospiraceae bacterium]